MGDEIGRNNACGAAVCVSEVVVMDGSTVHPDQEKNHLIQSYRCSR